MTKIRELSTVWRSDSTLWPHILMAILGIGWAGAIDIGVRLYFAEVIAITLVPFINWKGLQDSFPLFRSIIKAYALWVVAILISDTYNNVDLFDSARAIATPVIGAFTLAVSLAAISRDRTSLLTFFAATAVGKAMFGEPLYGAAFENWQFGWDSIQQDTNYFKVRFEPFISPAVVFFACIVGKRHTLTASAVLLVTAVAYFSFDARASGIIMFSSAIAVVVVKRRIELSKEHLLMALCVTLLIGYCGYVAYVQYTLSYNPSGHNGRQLALLESPYNPLELLLQGRPEWNVMPSAIAERPLLGWGSWAVDPGSRFSYQRSLETNRGAIDIDSLLSAQYYIPAHSVIGSTWIWAGLLGLLAMLYLLRIILALSRRLAQSLPILLPAVSFLLMLTLWHFFFSPPQSVRLSFPIALAALLSLTPRFGETRHTPYQVNDLHHQPRPRN